MTKHEAISYLQRYQTTLRGDEGKLICSLDMAIKSLISETRREKCSRTAVMTREEASEIINNYFFYTVLPRCNGKVVTLRRLEEAIHIALDVLEQSEQKKGKWINCGTVRDGIDEYTMFRCSECIQPNYKMSRFCPNCGAKMEGEGDDNAD